MMLKNISRYANKVRYHFLRLVFILRRNSRTLREFVAFAADNNLPLPLKDTRFQASLLSLASWPIDSQDQPYFYACVEKFLADHAKQVPTKFWHLWLTSHRELERPIEPLKPITAQALFQAQQHGFFKRLPQQDLDYLLQAYLQSYGRLLRDTPIDQARHLLPLLIEYATIAHLTKGGPEALNVFRHWLANARTLPRAVSALSDADAFQAPIRGIGSPHGVCVTSYREDISRELVQMAFAGMTGDRTLNAHLFACLFGVALACDSEPTILTLGGGIFTLKVGQADSSVIATEKLISATIGPAGPIEPRQGVAALGMSPQEAMLLTKEGLKEIQEDTGLLQLQDLRAGPARALEAVVARRLAAKQEPPGELRSDPNAPATSAIHMMPMLYRKTGGIDEVVPIEIEVPYSVLGSQKVFTLLQTTRSAYMQQLIIAGEQRRVFAEQIFREEDERVKYWAQLSEADKQAMCERSPFVLLATKVDFELGIAIPINPPKTIDRRKYEEVQRPLLRDFANQRVEQFKALCQQLVELNQEGGRADTITFKLLIDSMIRRASLPIASAEFQQEYQEWVQISAAPIWAAIEQWAVSHGLSSRVLAADNIVFNARVDAGRERLVLRPWVMLDLHDYVISIDTERGLMEVQPGGKTRTISELLQRDQALNVTDLQSLHTHYSEWVAEKLGLEQQRDQKEEEAHSAILRDADVGILIQLQLAKAYLFQGDVANAQQVIDRIKKHDKAAIYFWGGVIKEYASLSQITNKPAHATSLQWTSQLISRAVSNVCAWLSPEPSEGLSQLLGGMNAFRPGLDNALRGLNLLKADERVTAETRLELRQLRATKDESFLQGLVSGVSIPMLELESFRLSEESRHRYYAAQDALSSLQYLRLAEAMKQVTCSLSFNHGTTTDIGRQIRELLTQAEAMPFGDQAVVKQMSDLADQFGPKLSDEDHFDGWAAQLVMAQSEEDSW